MADPVRLLADEAEAWAAFRAAADATDPARRDEAVTSEDWSATDTLVHVAWWLDECGRVLEAIGDGSWDPAAQPDETPSYVDRVNADHVRASRGFGWARADRTLIAARERARAAFAALPAVGPDAWSWFEESGALHYATHMRDLEARSFGGGADGER